MRIPLSANGTRVNSNGSKRPNASSLAVIVGVCGLVGRTRTPEKWPFSAVGAEDLRGGPEPRRASSRHANGVKTLSVGLWEALDSRLMLWKRGAIPDGTG